MTCDFGDCLPIGLVQDYARPRTRKWLNLRNVHFSNRRGANGGVLVRMTDTRHNYLYEGCGLLATIGKNPQRNVFTPIHRHNSLHCTNVGPDLGDHLGTDEIGAALPGDESGSDFITIFHPTNIKFEHGLRHRTQY